MATERKAVLFSGHDRRYDIEVIRQALIDGEQSGNPERIDFAEFKRRKAAQHGRMQHG